MPTPASWLARLHAGEDAGATLRGPGGSLLREHDVPVHALVEQRGVRSHGVFGIGLKIDVLSPHAVLKVMDLRDSLGNPAPAKTVCVSDVLLAVDGKSVENVRQRPASQRARGSRPSFILSRCPFPLLSTRRPPRELLVPGRGMRRSWRATFSARKTAACAWPCARLQRTGSMVCAGKHASTSMHLCVCVRACTTALMPARTHS